MMKERTRHTDFSWTAWTPQEIAAMPDALAAEKQRAHERIKTVPASERTLANTLFAYDRSHHPVADAARRIWLLKNAGTHEAVRTAASDALARLESLLVDVEHDEEMYRAFRELSLPQDCDSASVKLYEDVVREYRRMGFDLSKEQQDHYKRNLKRLAELGSEFDKNLNNARAAMNVSERDLAGVPSEVIARLERVQTPDGEKLTVTTDYTDYIPVMKYCRNASLRRELVILSECRAGTRNLDILAEMVALRAENASLLGYETHADYVTEESMAKTGETAMAFLSELRMRITPRFEQERRMLREAKHREIGTDEPLAYEDFRYYMECVTKQKSGIDHIELQQYFPMEGVLAGMMDVYQELLGVRFQNRNVEGLWHSDVRFYDVSDTEGRYIGSFMLDLHPRDGKYTHACMSSISKGRYEDAERTEFIAPLIVMLCNFTKPTKTSPSLLTHNEVETLFHEFGHVMHGVLTEAPYIHQSGTSVAQDFVEAPSQMLEYWTWNADTLKRISGHWKTGVELPDALIGQLIASRHVTDGLHYIRQLALGLLDMALHMRPHPVSLTAEDIDRLWKDIWDEATGIPVIEGTHFPATFGHLNGYDAAYYGYAWSEVFAADMASRFRETGMMDRALGRRYRTEILAPGSSRDESDSLRAFLGREPSQEAFFEELRSQ